MGSKTLDFDPMVLGKALAVMNFVFGLLLLVVFSLLGMDMKAFGWQVLLVSPFLMAVAGFAYGYVGGKVYQVMVKKKDFLLDDSTQEKTA